jgi:hypothetical protein
LKFGIIGVGRMGQRHLQIAKALAFEIVGLHDPSQEAVGKTLSDQSLPQSMAFGSADELLDGVKPQALVVSSTAPSHCELVCRAAQAGVRYILCEKPMAVSLRECDRMMEACAAVGATLGINHQMRYMEQYTTVKALADSPELGGLRSMTVAASNIGFAMNASHYFEAFRYLADEEVASVSAWIEAGKLPNPRGPQYEDRSGRLLAVTKSGRRLYMELGADQGHGLQVIYGCHLGQIFSDQLSGFLRVSHREPQDRDLPTSRYGMPAVESIRHIAQADVVAPTVALWRSMLNGGSFPDGRCGRHAVAGIVAANLSGEQGGGAVRLDAAPLDRMFAWA